MVPRSSACPAAACLRGGIVLAALGHDILPSGRGSSGARLQHLGTMSGSMADVRGGNARGAAEVANDIAGVEMHELIEGICTLPGNNHRIDVDQAGSAAVALGSRGLIP